MDWSGSVRYPNPEKPKEHKGRRARAMLAKSEYFRQLSYYVYGDDREWCLHAAEELRAMAEEVALAAAT